MCHFHFSLLFFLSLFDIIYSILTIKGVHIMTEYEKQQEKEKTRQMELAADLVRAHRQQYAILVHRHSKKPSK